MGLGLMNKKAQLISKEQTTDSEGFNCPNLRLLAELRVFVEEKHASERWANLGTFSEATNLFRFRKIPGVIVKPSLYIVYNGDEYNILSVEDIKERGMYYEVLAKKVVPSNG